MMAPTFSRLPLAAGGAIASALGQTSLWAISHFMRAPLAYSTIIAMGTLTVMAGSNALYFQSGRHPAPLFAPSPMEVAQILPEKAVPEPALANLTPEIVQPAQIAPPRIATVQPAAVMPQATASVSASDTATEAPTGNSEVYAVQKKLADMRYFSGKVDGYYGPQTATAIRAFEVQEGLRPLGALNRDVIEAIMRAPIEHRAARRPEAELRPALQPEPVQVAALTPAATQPVLQPTAPPPQPLGTLVQPDPIVLTSPAQQQLNGQVVTQIPAQAPMQQVAAQGSPVVLHTTSNNPTDQLLDAAGDTAASAFDLVAGAIQNITAPLPTRAANGSGQGAVIVPPAQVAATTGAAAMEQATTGDRNLIARVQRGLMNLGFLAGSADGIAGETTARAVRNFEVYYNYQVTGRVTPELVGMLQAAGAQI